QGLAFANHHVFGLMLLAVVAPTLGRIFARRGFLGLMGVVAAPILGFSAWVYVPIRGHLHPFINIGEASRLTRTFWVLNADPWWGPSDAPEPSVLAQLREGLGGTEGSVSLLLFALAFFGLMMASRAPSQRRFALLWLIALVVPFACIAWILEPKLLADAWGALVPCAFALVALACCGLGLLLQAAARRYGDLAFRRGSGALASAMLLMLVFHADARGLAHFEAPDALDDLSRRNLPTRAVVLSREFGSWFRHLGGEAEEQLRADVTLIPLGALTYPHMVESISESAPELSALMNDAYRSGRLELVPVRKAAELRPVLLELDALVARVAYPWLEHDGLFERLREHPNLRDLTVAERESIRFEQLYARLGAGVHQAEVATLLTRTHLGKAIVSAELGERGTAMMHARLGLVVAPDDTRLLKLWAALDSRRPFDPSSLWHEED
ncbi:MAG: hypothetical protein JWN04_749, partial [Myxococcaceae bacterium]|nr:hypothetical protein [Myxococcaceae bacterium]